MKVLLTGPFGNIGSHTIPALLAEGHAVRSFDLDSPAHRALARRFDGLETHWGDVRDPGAVKRAVEGVDAVIHLAAIIPPTSNQVPDHAQAVNVGGTQNVLGACRAQERPPMLLFASSLDVHGVTQARPPPRRVDDPLVGTDPYTIHKIACEEQVRGSGLDWCILRLADVPVLGLREPHPILFEIGLHNRIESLHADDAGLALARALRTPEVRGRVLFVGGGPSCQLTYGEYLGRLLDAMGIGMLPAEAFSTADYCTDWLDTDESQRLLRYQCRTFDDIVAAVAACLGWKRLLVPVAAPLVRRALLELSPYWKRRRAARGRS